MPTCTAAYLPNDWRLISGTISCSIGIDAPTPSVQHMNVNHRRADIAATEEFLIRMGVIRVELIETSIDTFESLVLSEDWGAEQSP